MNKSSFLVQTAIQGSKKYPEFVQKKVALQIFSMFLCLTNSKILAFLDKITDNTKKKTERGYMEGKNMKP